VRALVHEIVDRAMSYNSTQTEQELTSNKPTFFVRFSGHTAALYVNIHANGWEPDSKSEDFDIYLSERDYSGTADEIQNELVSILKRMEEIYTNWYEKEYANE
ncbi:MAG: hypothetical protein IJ305_08735, partial [Oscillospiraceae bacterium]|nr:hypothetical protein [Oscillospiraceae bacterium]